MTPAESAALIEDQRREIARLRDMLRAFDPELAACNVKRLALDDPEAIQYQLATSNWDVALLLKFEDLPKQ